jgi:hypothetical protein
MALEDCVAAAAGLAADAADAVPAAPLEEPDPAAAPPAVDPARVLDGETATSNGALRLVGAPPPTSDPTTTPNASIPRTATAAARGAGIHESIWGEPENAASTSWRSVRLTLRPCSRIAPITSVIECGNPPRRAPHSTQYR